MKKFNIYKFLEERPLSWSAYSCFNYSPGEWYRRYILGEKDPPNAEMKFGSFVGTSLAEDSDFLPHIKRFPSFEHKLLFKVGRIFCIGFIDESFFECNKFKETKTGVGAWTQKKVDDHGQITMYALGLYLQKKINPDEQKWQLQWFPTKRVQDKKLKVIIAFRDEVPVPEVFITQRSMVQCLEFANMIEKTVKAMQKYVDTIRA